MSRKFLKSLVAGVLFVLPIAAQSAQINVTTLVDEDVTNADCSLREAIVAANTDAANKGCTAGSGADTIRFTAQGIIVLTANLPNITRSLSIIGPGITKLAIDGDQQFKMFYFYFKDENDDASYVLKGLSLIDGSSPIGSSPAVHMLDGVNVVVEDAFISGMTRTGADAGGAIGGQSAILTVRRTTFFNNSTLGSIGGAISVLSSSTLTVEDSLFAGNSTTGVNGDGGALAVGNGSTATLRRSTFSGNTSSDDGGAIAMFASNASLTIENCTFTLNSAAGLGGALMLNAGTATIKNTVFAANQISPLPGVGTPTSNISHTGATLTSLGHNLIGDNEGAATAFPAGNPNVNADYVGTAASPISAGLGALQDNGGPTRTHQVQAASALFDQGSCAGEPHDQRLYSNGLGGRTIDNQAISNSDDGCDIGAFERGALQPEPLFLDGFETVSP